MYRVLLLALLLAPISCLADSVYRTTDEQGNVVFSDTPPANTADTVERIDIQPINTAAPPEPLATPTAKPEQPEGTPFNVTITDPANETSFPMGPGNFSARARVEPDMPNNGNLQLFVDGTPWGDPQRGATWALTNVFRGQHDLTVGLIDSAGESVAMSEPVRVYVHRPSINFRNRAN
jgi:hypothetical protein